MAYQIVLLLFSCLFLHTLALDCEVVSGNLMQIDAGSGSVVGVNDKNEIFVLHDNVFTKIAGSLKHISVGPAGLVGVNSANGIFKLRGGSFFQLPGALKQIDAGGDQIVAGVNVNNNVFCFNMDSNNKWQLSSNPWVHLSGKLKYYSCGLYSCWGVSSDSLIWLKMNVSSNVCSGAESFVNIPGHLSMIEVSTDGSIFGINSAGNLFIRSGVTQSSPAGKKWTLLTACPYGNKHVSYDLGWLWVICIDGSIRKCPLNTEICH